MFVHVLIWSENEYWQQMWKLNIIHVSIIMYDMLKKRKTKKDSALSEPRWKDHYQTNKKYPLLNRAPWKSLKQSPFG